MKYKLIVSDFDGTALRSDKTVSSRLVNAIKEYRKAGGTFVISSGRMFESIVNHAHLLGLGDVNMPISAQDGGVIKESLTKKEISVTSMPKSDVLAFALECERLELYFQVYSADTLFVSEANDFNRRYCEVSKIEMKQVGKLSEFISMSKLDFVKVLVHDDAEKYLKYFDNRYKGIQFFLSSATFLDGASVGAGKGNGLKKLCSYLSFDISESVAIGDSMNDISMIEAAGLGVSVDNGDARLKERADFIAPSNDDDGVAYIIERALEDTLP